MFGYPAIAAQLRPLKRMAEPSNCLLRQISVNDINQNGGVPREATLVNAATESALFTVVGMSSGSLLLG